MSFIVLSSPAVPIISYINSFFDGSVAFRKRRRDFAQFLFINIQQTFEFIFRTNAQLLLPTYTIQLQTNWIVVLNQFHYVAKDMRIKVFFLAHILRTHWMPVRYASLGKISVLFIGFNLIFIRFWLYVCDSDKYFIELMCLNETNKLNISSLTLQISYALCDVCMRYK